MKKYFVQRIDLVPFKKENFERYIYDFPCIYTDSKGAWDYLSQYQSYIMECKLSIYKL